MTSGQWSRSTENWTSALRKFQQHPFCNFVPDSRWIVFFDRVPLFSEPRPMNDHCPLPNLLAYKDTSRAFARHSFSLSSIPQEMSLNIERNSLAVKLSGVSPNLYSKLLTSSLSCNVLNPEKYSLEFHRLTVDSVKVSVILRRCNSILFLQASLGFRILMDLSKTQHRIRKDVDLRALKIDDSFVTN